MSHPQMIKTPAGERMVILPLKEYEQLLDTSNTSNTGAIRDTHLFWQHRLFF